MASKKNAAQFVETFTAVKRYFTALAAQTYASTELGPMQVQYLRHIGEHASISQAELARATDTDPALTGRGLQTLIEREWVRRARSEEDRRGYLLELSPAGRRVLKRVEALRAELMERAVEPLDARDLEDFERIRAKLIAKLDGGFL